MDLLTGNIKKIYKKYLFAALGSAVIASIYSLVDMVAVGQYEGEIGSAALSVIMPLWSVISSIGLLLGIGGSVMFSVYKGKGDTKKGNEYFSASLIIALTATAVITLIFAFAAEPLIVFFGADETVLPCAMEYMKWLLPGLSCFLLAQYFTAFLRNDGAPMRATAAVLAGGIFNIFGDIFFVFTCDMGAKGAGLATAMGQVITLAVLLSHFFTKKNTLRMCRVKSFAKSIKEIFTTGFAPFVIDVSFGIIVIIFNNQIMHYAGTVELSIFGVIVNTTVLIFCLAAGAAQALQPIASVNFGAKKYDRLKTLLSSAMKSALIICIIAFAVVEAVPNAVIMFFMDASPEVFAAAPDILRVYSIAFLFFGVSVVASYYLQSILKSKESMLLSLLRGFILYIILLYLLPAVFGFDSIWLTMPITEGITMIIALAILKKSNSQLKKAQA